MGHRTLVKLRPETIAALDELAVVEVLDRRRREQRDLEILNGHAEELNREAEDCLAFQT
jgi:hypothetical protein